MIDWLIGVYQGFARYWVYGCQEYWLSFLSPGTDFNEFELPSPAGSNLNHQFESSWIFNFESVVEILTGSRKFRDVAQIH